MVNFEHVIADWEMILKIPQHQQENTCVRVSTFPANIRLDEDVLKTSFVFVFRRRFKDVLIKTNIFALALQLQKTSSRHLEDVLVKTNVFVLAICLQDVFKTSSRRLAKISSRRFQGVPSS